MIGTGPFKLKSFRPGVGMLAEKYANFHFEGTPHVDEVETFGIGDTAARINALLAGDIHFTVRVDPKSISIINGAPGVTMANAKSSRHLTLPMMADRPPTDNHDLRQALRLLVDRKAVLENIQKGFGAVGNDIPLSPAQAQYNSNLEQRSYDPDKAKFYFKQAGVEGMSFDLLAADAAFSGAVDAAALIQNSANAAGIKINIVREPNDGYWGDVWMNKAWCACYWGGRPTADLMFSTAYQTGAAWNDSFWSNARFDELLVAARGELDEAKRRGMYWEMQAILNQDGGVIIPMFASYVFATSNKIGHGDQFASNWDADGERWAERWWFA